MDDEIDITNVEFIKPIPVFINSVISTLQNLPLNINRINAWSTFLEREIWEVATKNEMMVSEIFQKLGWRYIIAPDEPGLIAARIVGMIVNEAYFAYGDKISSKTEIDLAMRLGTNYPYGPFEWSKKIGLNNIYNLLNNLRIKDNRYIIAKSLENEVFTYNNI